MSYGKKRSPCILVKHYMIYSVT